MPSRRDLANAIRVLSMDAVQRANSGHPGAPMGMADIAQVLWNDHLKYNPMNAKWSNRDRFVLSNGHGSMLIYSLLHLSGYDLNMDDIKNFRQLHARTAGHPEYGYVDGIETTTGPLGQGITNAVGMAIAERTLGAQFNKLGHNIVDHNTYVFMGDGCLMEGLSHESCAMAGTLGLGKLIVFGMIMIFLLMAIFLIGWKKMWQVVLSLMVGMLFAMLMVMILMQLILQLMQLKMKLLNLHLFVHVQLLVLARLIYVVLIIVMVLHLVMRRLQQLVKSWLGFCSI